MASPINAGSKRQPKVGGLTKAEREIARAEIKSHPVNTPASRSRASRKRHKGGVSIFTLSNERLAGLIRPDSVDLDAFAKTIQRLRHRPEYIQFVKRGIERCYSGKINRLLRAKDEARAAERRAQLQRFLESLGQKR